jgi:uncharacterized protein with GYD domain
MTAALAEQPEVTVVRYEPRGAAKQLWTTRDPVVIMCGPTGTGKTLAALWKLHYVALQRPKFKGLIVRQTHASLTGTTLVSFDEEVIAAALLNGTVKWFGGSARKPPAYIYSNGSTITIGGLDKPVKWMGGQYDRVVVDEATEISTAALEALITRMRAQAKTFKQIILCCNPDHPKHWLYTRAQEGALPMLHSRHQDNPRYFRRIVEADGSERFEMTAEGRDYIEGKLGLLTGVRRLRYVLGQWAAADGVVYDEFDANVHLIDSMPAGWESWTRWWTVDFGFSNPFVCYDDQTDVLTDQGWKRFADLDRTERVATTNMETHVVEWQRPTDYIVQDYSGPMVQASSSRAGADFCVTPNHRMVLENRKRGGWSIHRADQMPTGNYSIPMGWEPIEDKGGDPIFARFLGLWLADGCLTFGGHGKKQPSIRITQKNRVDAVRAVIADMGVTWSERVDTHGVTDFRINDKDLIDRTFGMCGKVYSAQKRIPAGMLTWGRDSLEALLDGLLMGDGSPEKRDERGVVIANQVYITTSTGLADDVQAVASLLGLPTTRTVQHTTSGYTGRPIDVFTVRFAARRRAALSGMNLTAPHYSGRVYCVTVPNGTLIVRRNGKPMVSGNCQCWAQDGDGRIYLYREIYMSKRLVEDHAKQILGIVAPGGTPNSDGILRAGTWIEPKPRAIICDHDAEDRATLERHLGMTTKPAKKAPKAGQRDLVGLQATQARYKIQADGKPRIFFVRGCTVELDRELKDAGKPTSTVDELSCYVWPPDVKPEQREHPVKENDHGADATRYLVAELDQGQTKWMRWVPK